MDNRRKYRRIDLKLDVLHGTIDSGISANLSEGGLCLVTPAPFERDQETTLLFHLTNNERKFIKTIGKVSWNRKLPEGGYESGVDFRTWTIFTGIKSSNSSETSHNLEKASGSYSMLVREYAENNDLNQSRKELSALIGEIPLHTPREMSEMLESYGYIGQESAKKAVCLMAYRHINRIKKVYVDKIERQALPSKENLLLLGPTGCGKTFMIELLFQKILNIPTVIIDITSYSETGYVGQDVPGIITKLIYAAGDFPEFATIGIVCIDEFDKIASSKNTAVFAGQGTTKDVTGFGVQRELLRMLEASMIDVPLELSHSTYAPRIRFNTVDVPFIACGAFTGFREVLRQKEQAENIGFNRKNGPAGASGISTPLTRDDIEKAANFEAYGLMPELVGRFSRIVPFESLSRDDLKRILRINTVEQYKNELALDNITLTIEEDVYDTIVAGCMKKETGARGLKSLITEHLEQACFDVYSDPAARKGIRLFVDSGKVAWALT